MATATRRSIAAIAIMALVAVINLLGPTTAAAQCTTYTVTNNTRCDLILVVYNAAGDLVKFRLPASSATPITLPRGFGAPVGIITAGGAQVPFGRDRCTPCASIPTGRDGDGCCATICPDLNAPTRCALVIEPCSGRCIQ